MMKMTLMITHCFLAISQGGRVDFESPDASRVEEERVGLANLRLIDDDDDDDDDDCIVNI